MFAIAEIKDVFNAYVSGKGLINPRDQQYINVSDDSALFEAISIKNEETPDFLKREDALRRIRENMQSWHEVRQEGSDPVRKCVRLMFFGSLLTFLILDTEKGKRNQSLWLSKCVKAGKPPRY